jgi:hypothetical protein
MRQWLMALVLATVAFGWLASVALAEVPTTFRVGTYSVDITPDLEDGRMLLAGFGPFLPLSGENRWAEGIHDRIWARSLAVQGSSGQTLLLMTVDLPGLVWKHINPVRRELARDFGIPEGNIVIHSTHTHSAPDGAGYWTTLIPGHNSAYTDRLRVWLYRSGAQALARLEPAKMRSALTTHYSCINPRTRVLKKDPDCNLPDNDPEFRRPGADYDAYLIQSDERDPIVRNTRIAAAQFVNAYTGRTIATFVHWNNHPDTLDSSNRLLSSDYPHYLREYVERELGGVALYFVGTLGNQIGALHGVPAPLWNERFERVYSGELDAEGEPVPALVTEGYEKIRSIGYEVADEAVRALKQETWQDDPLVWIKTEPLDVAVDNPVHVVMTGSVWNYGVEREDRMKHYQPRCGSLQGCVRTDVSVLQIGDLGIGTAPGEVDPAYFLGRHESVADYGERWGKWKFPAMPAIEPYLPGRIHLMLGSANNYLSYLVPTSDNVGWLNGSHPNCYEEQVTVGKDFGDDAGNKLMQMLGSPVRYSNRDIRP